MLRVAEVAQIVSTEIPEIVLNVDKTVFLYYITEWYFHNITQQQLKTRKEYYWSYQ